MKKFIYSSIIMLSVLMPYPVTAQENVLFYDLQNAKQSNVEFQDISASLVNSGVDKSFLKDFINEKEVTAFQYIPSGSKSLGSALNSYSTVKSRECCTGIAGVSSFV
jgi:hypothetical protein